MTRSPFRALAVLAVAAALAGAGPALATPGRAVSVVRLLAAQIAAVRGHDGGIPVLLPDTLALARPAYAAGVRRARGYELVIGDAPGCDGANVCVLADFAATPGARVHGAPVILARGLRGGYAPAHCAGDCTAATIGWSWHGALYTIEARPAVAAAAVRGALVAAANRAIAAGPR